MAAYEASMLPRNETKYVEPPINGDRPVEGVYPHKGNGSHIMQSYNSTKDGEFPTNGNETNHPLSVIMEFARRKFLAADGEYHWSYLILLSDLHSVSLDVITRQRKPVVQMVTWGLSRLH